MEFLTFSFSQIHVLEFLMFVLWCRGSAFFEGGEVSIRGQVGLPGCCGL